MVGSRPLRSGLVAGGLVYAGALAVPGAMDAYQQAADWYQAEESTSAANQCLLKVDRTLTPTRDPNP